MKAPSKKKSVKKQISFQKKILCIESLAGSFENCINLGVENKIVKELEFFKKKQGSVYYLSKDTKKFNFKKSISHITLPKNTPKAFRNLVYLFYPFFNLNIFKKNDIYYIHNISGSFPAVIAKLILKKKKVVSKYDWNWAFTFKKKYSYPVYIITKILEHLSIKHSDLIIASTKRLKNDIHIITKDPKKKVIVIPNWVDPALFKPPRKKLKRKNPLLISIGRLDEGKNHMLLLESIKKLRSLNPEVMIIGNGDKKDELLNFAQQNNINLEIKGGIPNKKIPRLLQKADLFVMTSKYEGLPHVLIEALSCGLPVVGTDVRGIKDIIKNNYNGLLCEENPIKIANAIKYILNDKKAYDKFSKNAIKTVKPYSFSQIMEKIYKNIKNEN